MKEVKMLFAPITGTSIDKFRLDISYIPYKVCVKSFCYYSGGDPVTHVLLDLPVKIVCEVFDTSLYSLDNKLLQYVNMEWNNTFQKNYNNWFNISVYTTDTNTKITRGYVMIIFEFTKPVPIDLFSTKSQISSFSHDIH